MSYRGRRRDKSADESRRIIAEFEKYIKKSQQRRSPSPYNPRRLPPMKLLSQTPLRNGLTDPEYFFSDNDGNQTYEIQVRQHVTDWTIEEYLIRNVCPHSCLLEIRGPALPNILIESKYYKRKRQVKIHTRIEGQDEDTIQWKDAPNQYIGAIRELIPYLLKVSVPAQELTTPTALLASLKLRQLIDTPFITLIITDPSSGRRLLREMKNYTGRSRLRISFEYMDDMKEFDINWNHYKNVTNFHFFKGYFPSFTKDVLLRAPQRSIMVMNCDIEPDELIEYVEAWRYRENVLYEGCCIGFKEFKKDAAWNNFKKTFPTMRSWSDYPEWSIYNDVIQYHNWNFHVGNAYNLSRPDGYTVTLVLSNKFFIMAVTDHPKNTCRSVFNSALLRLRLNNYCFYPLITTCMSKYGSYYNRYNDCTASCEKN